MNNELEKFLSFIAGVLMSVIISLVVFSSMYVSLKNNIKTSKEITIAKKIYKCKHIKTMQAVEVKK